MHLLKSMGGGAASSAKPGSPSNKKNYFSSLKLEDEKAPASGKENSKNKKAGPPKGFIPENFALDFDPPCIILEYRNPETNKLYHHKMKIKKLKRETSSKEALDYLKKKHYHYFIPKVIDEQQLEKLIDKLKNGLTGGKQRPEIEDVDEEDDFEFDYDDDFQDD